METRPVRPYFPLQLVLELSVRFDLLLWVALIATWTAEIEWYFHFARAILLVCESLRMYTGFRGNLAMSLQWSLAAIAFGIFPVLPAELALVVAGGEKAWVRGVLGVHVALVIIGVVLGGLGVVNIVRDYRMKNI
jgi:hypothetical protein